MTDDRDDGKPGPDAPATPLNKMRMLFGKRDSALGKVKHRFYGCAEEVKIRAGSTIGVLINCDSPIVDAFGQSAQQVYITLAPAQAIGIMAAMYHRETGLMQPGPRCKWLTTEQLQLIDIEEVLN